MLFGEGFRTADSNLDGRPGPGSGGMWRWRRHAGRATTVSVSCGLRGRVALAPRERLPEAALHDLAQLARLGLSASQRLVVNDLIVEGHLEDPFGTGPQLEADQGRSPAIENLCCPTDSFIQVISGDAVLDDDVVLWVDHLDG